MPAETLRVLLVEDNADDAELLSESLAEVCGAPLDLTRVERLDQALARLRDERFDVVLSDLGLPDSRGLETFVQLRDHAPGVPIVVLTGLDDETVAVRAVQEGAQDYLCKGQLTGHLLVRSLRYAVERQRTLEYRALIMEREHFDAAVSAMSDGMVVTAGDWRLVTANRAACLLLNLPQDGWKGLPLDDALRPFALSVPLAELRASRECVTAFEIARPATKPPLFLDARLTRLSDPAGRLASTVLMLRDVTEQRHAQNLQVNFFNTVTHKLATPLSVVGGWLQLCRRLSPERLAQKLPGILEICDAELRRLTDVVRKLLDFKALSAQQLAAGARLTEVAPAIAAALEAIRPRYPARRIEATTAIAPDAAHADASPEHLGFVLEKLLDNAAKFAERDPARIEVRVERQDPAWLRFSVADNGPGIPHEYHDRVFEGFIQVEDRPTGQVPGLGVGLYLARQVVRAYGGAMAIESRLGEGTTLAFTLPAARFPGGQVPHPFQQ